MELSTRSFLKLSGSAALAAGGWASFAGPAPKVRLAAIGTGGRGNHDLHNFLRSGLAEITCACDVFAPALDWVRKEQPQAKLYTDFRQMLRECAGRYDAVSIMTPDHTHCTAFLEAAKYNVPVYCAKPLGHTFAETLAMMRVAQEKKLITQVSHHGNSEPGTPLFREWYESGALGQAKEAHVFCNYGAQLFALPPAWVDTRLPVPKGLDWELWQGPAKRRPFFKSAAPKSWRGWSFYGEGCITDWCCHLMGPLVVDLDLDMPIAVTMDDPSFNPVKTPYNFPTAPHYTFEFAAKGSRGPFKLHWYDVYRLPPRPTGLEADQPFDPIKEKIAGGWITMEKETLMFGQTGLSGIRCIPQTRMRAFQPIRKTIPKKYPRIKNHWAEFLQAVQQKRPANTPFALGGKLTLMGLMGMIATRFPGKRLTFDESTMRFTNCPAANALMTPDWTDEARATYGAEVFKGFV